MNDGNRPKAAQSDAADVETILAELRTFHAAGLRVLLDPALRTAQRQVAMRRLLDRARASMAPEFACRGLERALVDVVFGADPEREVRDRWLAEALRRSA